MGCGGRPRLAFAKHLGHERRRPEAVRRVHLHAGEAGPPRDLRGARERPDQIYDLELLERARSREEASDRERHGGRRDRPVAVEAGGLPPGGVELRPQVVAAVRAGRDPGAQRRPTSAGRAARARAPRRRRRDRRGGSRRTGPRQWPDRRSWGHPSVGDPARLGHVRWGVYGTQNSGGPRSSTQEVSGVVQGSARNPRAIWVGQGRMSMVPWPMSGKTTWVPTRR